MPLDNVWAVDHLVRDAKGGRSFERYAFELERAHDEIARVAAHLATLEAGEASPKASGVGSLVDMVSALGSSMTSGMSSAYAELTTTPGRSPIDMSVCGEAVEVGVQTRFPPTPPREADLEELVESLEAMNAKMSDANKGPEGKVAEHVPEIRGGDALGDRSGAVDQPCPYAGMRCWGCDQPFALGEKVRSQGAGLVHPLPECEAKAKAREDEALAVEMGTAAVGPFFAVYSDEIGAAGVYSSREEAERWAQGESEEDLGVMKEFDTLEEAEAFVKEKTHERAVQLASYRPKKPIGKGSELRINQIVEHVVPTFAQAVNIQHLFQQLPYPQATPQPPPSQAPAGQKNF